MPSKRRAYTVDETVTNDALQPLLKVLADYGQCPNPPPSLMLTAAAVRYLTGPVILHPGGWEVPEHLHTTLPLARLRVLLAGESALAAEEDALIHLCTASLNAPLDSDWVHIYLWLAQECLPRWRLTNEPVWQALGKSEPIALTHYQQSELLDLRRRLRESIARRSSRRFTRQS